MATPTGATPTGVMATPMGATPMGPMATPTPATATRGLLVMSRTTPTCRVSRPSSYIIFLQPHLLQSVYSVQSGTLPPCSVNTYSTIYINRNQEAKMYYKKNTVCNIVKSSCC